MAVGDRIQAYGFGVYDGERLLCSTAPQTPLTITEAAHATGAASRIAAIMNAACNLSTTEAIRRLRIDTPEQK